MDEFNKFTSQISLAALAACSHAGSVGLRVLGKLCHGAELSSLDV